MKREVGKRRNRARRTAKGIMVLLLGSLISLRPTVEERERVHRRDNGNDRRDGLMSVHFYADNDVFSGSETMLCKLVEAVAATGATPFVTFRTWPAYAAAVTRRLGEADQASRAEVIRMSVPRLPLVQRRLRSDRAPALFRLVRGVLFVSLRLPWSLTEIVQLWRLFRRTQPDVLHINNGGFPGAWTCTLAAIAGKCARIPVIVYAVHNLAVPYDRNPSRWLDWPFDRATVGVTSMFITGSRAAGEALSGVLRLGSAQLRVIPNAIENPRPDAGPGAGIDLGGGPILLVIARLEARKGHAVLLRALDRLRREGLQLPTVLFAGDGPERSKVEALIEEFDLSASVTLLGEYPHCGELLKLVDALVLPSIEDEDFPLCIVEAMEAECAVVATAVGGVPEQLVDGVSGYLVPPGDDGALAKALVQCIEDPDRRSAVAAAANIRFHELFEPDVLVRRYLDLYAGLLKSV